MSTRAEQVEAVERAYRDSDRLSDTPSLLAAAATLTRDGLLRERLSAYADELETSGDPEESATKRAIGAALKALLKETSDG